MKRKQAEESSSESEDDDIEINSSGTGDIDGNDSENEEEEVSSQGESDGENTSGPPTPTGTGGTAMLAGTATESNVSTDLSGYARSCQRTGEMASKANIKYRVKDLARKELFKHVKTYRGAVSEERKRKNKIWEDYVRKFFVSSLPKVSITDELWRVIQKHTTEALRSKRSSVTEAMKRIVTGKDDEALLCRIASGMLGNSPGVISDTNGMISHRKNELLLQSGFGLQGIKRLIFEKSPSQPSGSFYRTVVGYY